jgi:hypothetical protein
MVTEHDTGPGAADAATAAEAASTGEPRVDEAIRRLTELDDLPLSEHPRVYERVHEQLVEVLGELHVGQGPASPASPAAQAPRAGHGGARHEHE